MDMVEVKSFNAELSGLYDNKPPISKAKMSAITKGAIKAIKFYKHVVHSVEKFIQKCKPEYKVPGLYVIDSIVRQSRHQFGQDKDVFAPRFAKNMQQTFANLFRCPPEDKRNIIRVLNLWQKNHVFSSDVIQPLLDMADPNHPLHQEIQQQQNNTANGSSLNVTHNTTDNKISPVPAPLHTPHDSSPMDDQFQDQPSGPQPGVKFNRKLLNDFEYESEDDTAGTEPLPPVASSTHSSHGHQSHQAHQTHQQHQPHPSHQSHNPTDALGSILTNPEIMRQLQSLQAQMQMMTGMQIPNLMPMMSDMQLQQNSNQGLPFLSSQQESQKQNEPKEDMANESDIEFVETGPQVIEIPDANDSRSPSPRGRRHRSRERSRSRSKSPRRRRGRSRSRSPRRRRDKERERDRDKSHKEREADKERQRERDKKGLPPIKKENLSVCSTTLWVGHLSKLATPEELSDLFGACGGVQSIDVVAPRGCAFVVMERRRDAAKALAKLNRHKLHSKEITVAWAAGKGVKGREWKDYWEADLGVAYLPWEALQQRWAMGALSLDALEEGGAVDEETLPPWLPPRILPKAMDGVPLLGALGAPMPLAGALPPRPPVPLAAPPTPQDDAVWRRLAFAPRPQMPTMPAMSALPALPALPPAVPGLQRDGALLGFPGGVPPQPGMVGGFLGGLVGGLVLPMPPPHPQHAQPPQLHPTQHPPPPHPTPGDGAVVAPEATDDNMELDTDDAPLLPDQLQALVSVPPPFDASQPPPERPERPDKADKERAERAERPDKERRDRERSGRDRDRDRRDRDRDRRPRERDRERDERRDRDRDRGRERRDRDRDRERERERPGNREPNNRERSREKSPRADGEKSLQERLWEMANGAPAPSHAPPAAEEATDSAEANGSNASASSTAEPPPAAQAWPRAPPPHFRAELRMRGPPARPPVRGPWMDVQGPPFGPRFNGLGPPGPLGPPPFRPPFDMFEGPPRFERPPFPRLPFDLNRPPFDGPRPPFEGPRPPFDGPRPSFDGPRPPFDGPRPPFDGPPRQFDDFEGERSFDGPRFDGPPEFFDRGNRRFEEREQFGERGWNGERERDWDRRNEWDDRRKDRRGREPHEDRFRENRNDRRRTVEERPRQPREDRNSKREGKDRKSRWGAADEVAPSEETESVEGAAPEEQRQASELAEAAEENVESVAHVQNDDQNEEECGKETDAVEKQPESHAEEPVDDSGGREEERLAGGDEEKTPEKEEEHGAAEAAEAAAETVAPHEEAPREREEEASEKKTPEAEESTEATKEKEAKDAPSETREGLA